MRRTREVKCRAGKGFTVCGWSILTLSKSVIGPICVPPVAHFQNLWLVYSSCATVSQSVIGLSFHFHSLWFVYLVAQFTFCDWSILTLSLSVIGPSCVAPMAQFTVCDWSIKMVCSYSNLDRSLVFLKNCIRWFTF